DLQQGKEALEKFYFAMKKARRTDYPENAAKVISEFLWELRHNGKPKEYLRYEPVLRDVTTQHNKSALATKRPEDLERSIDGYKGYLWIYERSKYRNAIALNMAEAAFHAGHNVEAGLNYARLLQRTRDGKKRREYFASAFESLNRAFSDQQNLDILDKVQGRSAYIGMAGAFTKLYPTDKALPMVLYNLSKALYDSQDYALAAQRLAAFLKRFPRDQNASAASVLLLDCYYIRDDLKGLVKRGQQLLALPLESQVKSKVQEVIQASQLKRVRSLAGEFATRTYAKEFLKFANQSGRSELGESALLEAFVSLKAGQDPAALKIGSQFINQYGDSDKAKTVLSHMIQLALAMADFDKAATYLAAYSQKYPNDESSSKFALTAAQFFEATGDVDRAAQVYAATGDSVRAADIYFKSQKWTELQKISPKVPGKKGLYYQGLALYRSGDKAGGLKLLERAFTAEGSDEEKEYTAHAGYLLALNMYGKFLQTASRGLSAITDIKAKAAALAETDKILWRTIELGVGPWVIAALQMQAVMSYQFANFLRKGPAPKPLTAEQYNQLVKAQIETYVKNAQTAFGRCVSVAEEANVFSEFIESCRGKKLALVNESGGGAGAMRRPASKASVAPQLHAKLLKDSQNISLLNELAQSYLRAGDYPQANAIYRRILEVKPDDAEALASIGVVHLYMGSWENAYDYFEQAQKHEPKNATAQYGKAALFKRFGYKDKFEEAARLARQYGRPSGAMHPIMKF
ncbi:MAG: tetratricopeptide repeat protein, partial [Bdellovibrionales bacterium]